MEGSGGWGSLGLLRDQPLPAQVERRHLQAPKCRVKPGTKLLKMERNPLERGSWPRATHPRLAPYSCACDFCWPLWARLHCHPPAPGRGQGPGGEPGPGQAAMEQGYLPAECYVQITAQRERRVGRARAPLACCWEMLGNGGWRQQTLLEGRSRKEPGGLKSALRAEGDTACPGDKTGYN